MKLEEIIINNFMPYKGEQRVTFPQHETQNVMLLFGDNMRGKTSFLNSIRWGFYGTAVGRHLRPIPRVNLVNMDAAAEDDWSMSIALKFTHENKNYELNRIIQKKEHISQPKNDSDFEESIGLRIDGEIKTGDVVINEINQVIPEEISRFFLFDGELLQEYENLLIEESEQGEKIKEHIEQALGVPALVHGRDEFNSLLKSARRIQARDAKNNKDLKVFAEQQRQLEIELTSLEKDLEKLKDSERDIQKKVDDIDDELKNTEAVQRKKVELEGLKSEQKSVEQQLIDSTDEERELLRDVWKDILNSSVQPILNSLKNKRNTIQNSASKKAVLDARIKDLSISLENPICPTCKQEIHQSKIEPIQEELEELIAKAELSDVNMDDFGVLNGKIDKLSLIQSADECKRICNIVDKKRKLNVQLIRIETSLNSCSEIVSI